MGDGLETGGGYGGGVGAEGDVGVQEACGDREACEVPDAGIGWWADLRTDGHDHAVADHDGGIRELGAGTGEDAAADEGMGSDGSRRETGTGDGIRRTKRRCNREKECRRRSWNSRHGAQVMRERFGGQRLR